MVTLLPYFAHLVVHKVTLINIIYEWLNTMLLEVSINIKYNANQHKPPQKKPQHFLVKQSKRLKTKV